MTDRTPWHVGQTPFAPIGRSPRRCNSAPGQSAVKSGVTAKRGGVWDRALDGSTPKGDAGDHLGLQWLALAARLGLSLFITAGFAAGLSLYAGLTLADPNMVRACEGIFFWSSALILCGTSHRT